MELVSKRILHIVLDKERTHCLQFHWLLGLLRIRSFILVHRQAELTLKSLFDAAPILVHQHLCRRPFDQILLLLGFGSLLGVRTFGHFKVTFKLL